MAIIGESRRVRMLRDHESGAKKGNEVVVRGWQADEWVKLGHAQIVTDDELSGGPAPVNTGEDIATSDADVKAARQPSEPEKVRRAAKVSSRKAKAAPAKKK